MDSVLLATYDYQGAGRLVGTHLPEPSARNLRYDADTDAYDNHVDRFGRVIADQWTKELPPVVPEDSVDFYDVELGWDRSSNVTHAIDHVHPDFSFGYEMDDLDRLVDAEQGEWDDVAAEVGTTVSRQLWTLSHTGNWLEASFDRDGDSAFGGNVSRGLWIPAFAGMTGELRGNDDWSCAGMTVGVARGRDG